MRQNRINAGDLIDKTISFAAFMKHERYNDEHILALTFTDGSACYVVADYGGFSWDSYDEYQKQIVILGEKELSRSGNIVRSKRRR